VNEAKKVLAISSAYDITSLMHDLFLQSRAQIEKVNSIALAKRVMMNQSFDMVFIFTPVQDEFGIRSAREIQSRYDVPVLLFVRQDGYDQACYTVMDQMIFVMQMPVHKPLVIQTLAVIDKYQSKISALQTALKKEKQRVQDEKMISRCKLMLVQHYHWSEDKAHHYIEKVAMDHSWTRAKVAGMLMEKISQQMGDI
jgi:response regulator NasT